MYKKVKKLFALNIDSTASISIELVISEAAVIKYELTTTLLVRWSGSVALP